MKQKILIVELWGLGDLSFSLPFLKQAAEQNDLHVLSKPHGRDLLHPSVPSLDFTYLDPHWTRFRHKYRFWEWDWNNLFRVICKLRREHFDIGVSIRNDPRDHFLMWLLGVKRRCGFPTRGSGIFLNDPVKRPLEKRHRVEDWRDLGRHLGLKDIDPRRPCFDYCIFPEPYCMTKLAPETVWPEVREHVEQLIDAGKLPFSFRSQSSKSRPA
jgi:heptosyltransferase-2